VLELAVLGELTDELLDLTAVEKGYRLALYAKGEWMSCCCCCCMCAGG
jgi:hypothetical protein